MEGDLLLKLVKGDRRYHRVVLTARTAWEREERAVSVSGMPTT